VLVIEGSNEVLAGKGGVLTTVEFGSDATKMGLREAGGSVGPTWKVRARDWGDGDVNGQSGDIGSSGVAEAEGKVIRTAKGLVRDEIGGLKEDIVWGAN
jgi:hypothetical protein